MISHQLSDEEHALIALFKAEAKAVGFDGTFSLNPEERGVVAVANLVRQQTLLRIFKALGIKGSAAFDLMLHIHNLPVPTAEQDVLSEIRALYQAPKEESSADSLPKQPR